MTQPQFMSSNRSSLPSLDLHNHKADSFMREALVSRIHDRLSLFEKDRLSFRQHLDKAKNSTGSVVKKKAGKRKNSARGAVILVSSDPAEGAKMSGVSGISDDITTGPSALRAAHTTKSSGYGSDTDGSNALTGGVGRRRERKSSLVSTNDSNPHLTSSNNSQTVPAILLDDSESRTTASRDSNAGKDVEGATIEDDELDELVDDYGSGMRKLSHLSMLNDKAQSAGRRRKQLKLEREKTYPGHQPRSKHTTGLINWANMMSNRSGGLTRGSDEGSLDSNPAVNFLMRRYAYPEDEWTRQARRIAKEKKNNIIPFPSAADRLTRIATLRQNVQFIEGKFKSMLGKQRSAAAAQAVGVDTSDYQFQRTFSVASENTKDEYMPSRFTKPGEARSFFKQRGRMIIIVKRWIDMIMNMNKNSSWERQLKTFVDLAMDMEHSESENVPAAQEGRFTFNKNEFKANKEISLSMDVKTTLSTRPDGRTPEMIKQVMLGLQTLQSLGEYPLDTQEQICRVAWFQQVPARKYIIRQGHKPEAFYFVLSGTAVVKKIEADPTTGEEQTRVVARLSRGQSFGELGLIFKTPRNATVESGSAMDLLVVGKEDFLKIFMHNVKPGEDPDHIAFLKQQPVLRYWPFECLKEDPSACLINYFKRGTLVTDNGKASEWIYFVKSGSCEALKRLKSVTPRSEQELRHRSKSQPKDIRLPDIPCQIETSRKSQKHPLHPEIFRSMTDFFDDIRSKAETEARKKRRGSSVDISTTRRQVSSATKTDVPSIEIDSVSKHHRDSNKSVVPIATKQVYFKRTPPTEDLNPCPLPPIPPRVSHGPGTSQSKFTSLTKLLNKGHLKVPTTGNITDMYTEALPLELEEQETARDDREDVFVTVEKLQARDIFGMNTISFNEDEQEINEVPEVALVSRGAEVIMLSKRMYLKHADERDKLAVQELITPYPGENQLQENLQLQADWDVYKQSILEDVMYLNHAYKRTFTGVV